MSDEPNNVDDLLKDIYDPKLVSEARAKSEKAFETKMMKLILDKAELDIASTLYTRTKEKTGKAALTFAALYNEFPNFPIWLGFKKIPYVHKIPLVNFFDKFTKTPIFDAWSEVYDVALDNKSAAVIFTWPGLKGQALVLHDYFSNPFRERESPIIAANIKFGKTYHLFVIEKFDSFITQVLSDWQQC